MKRLFSKAGLVIILFFLVFKTYAQYSNSSLNGPWMTFTDKHTYLIFDGNGNINEFGVFNGVTGSNIGTYSVSSSGSVTGIFTIWSYTFTGQLLAADTGYLNVQNIGIIPIYKVTHPGALTETLSGTMWENHTSTPFSVTFTISPFGHITQAIGLSGVTGKIFAENGVFAGLIKTTDITIGNECMFQMMVQGLYNANDSILDGTFATDCMGYGGPLDLQRSGNATMSQILSVLSESEFSIYPNPFNDNIIISSGNNRTIKLKISDLSGKIVTEQILTSSSEKINNIAELLPGIYVLDLIQDGMMFSFKLVKE